MGPARGELIDLSLQVLNLPLLGGDGGGKIAKPLLVDGVLLVLRRGGDSGGIFDCGDLEYAFVKAKQKILDSIAWAALARLARANGGFGGRLRR